MIDASEEEIQQEMQYHFQNWRESQGINHIELDNQDSLVPQTITNQLRYVASLPLDRYDDFEGLAAEIQRKVFRLYSDQKLHPNPALRPQLEADLAFIAEAPDATFTKHWMLAHLVIAYLSGRYQPNPSLRESSKYDLDRLKFSNIDDDALRSESQAVLKPYLQNVRAYRTQTA